MRPIVICGGTEHVILDRVATYATYLLILYLCSNDLSNPESLWFQTVTTVLVTLFPGRP